MTAAIPDFPDVEGRTSALRGVVLGQLGDERRARRPSRSTVVRVVAPIAAASALAAILSVPGSAPTDALAVTRSDGWIELRITDRSASPQEMTEELRAAGVRGEVRVVPVPENLVGTWALIAEAAEGSNGSSAEEVVRLDRVQYQRDVLRMPASQLRESTGSFVFYIGRAARPGEQYPFPFARFGGQGFITRDRTGLPPSQP